MRRTLLVVVVCSLAFALRANASVVYSLWQGIPYKFVQSSLTSAQSLLIQEHLLPLTHPTGMYGPLTTTAVFQYQLRHNIQPTGVIGALTRTLMNEEIASHTTTLTDNRFEVTGQFSPLQKGEIAHTLSVPLFEQIYSLSCEAASLEMALAYKGVLKNQDDLIAEIPKALPFKKQQTNDGQFIWGDPSLGFVGDVRGWFFNSKGTIGATGWGADKEPVLAVAQKYRPNSTALTGASIESITREIDANNPVIVWTASLDDMPHKTLDSYQTPAGKTISFIPTHVNVIVGYKTTATGAVVLLINDPEYGRLEINQTTFENVWNMYHHDMLVVR